MKTVFNDISTVAHMWANKQQDSAKFRGGNFYYINNTIYSYGSHFPIARHVEYKGKKAVLLTIDTYSKTTAKHVWAVKSACNHLNTIYCLKPDPNQHDANFGYWISQSEGVLSRLKTARKPEKYLNELARIEDQAVKYAEFFDIVIPRQLKEILTVRDKGQYAEYEAKRAELLKAEQKKKEQEEKKKHKKALLDWEAGRTSRLYCRDGFDYLRAVSLRDSEGVETSQGVSIPYEIAEKFWERVKANSLKVGDVITDQYRHRYEVSETGDVIRIGCHAFKRDYILKFGKRIFVDRVI
jgi:hypothetical protein